MNNEIKFIDALLFADRDLTEGWGELQALGANRLYSFLETFMPIGSRPSILNVMETVKDLQITNYEKYLMLEAVSCDLGCIAIKLGFIDKIKVKL